MLYNGAGKGSYSLLTTTDRFSQRRMLHAPLCPPFTLHTEHTHASRFVYTHAPSKRQSTRAVAGRPCAAPTTHPTTNADGRHRTRGWCLGKRRSHARPPPTQCAMPPLAAAPAAACPPVFCPDVAWRLAGPRAPCPLAPFESRGRAQPPLLPWALCTVGCGCGIQKGGQSDQVQTSCATTRQHVSVCVAAGSALSPSLQHPPAPAEHSQATLATSLSLHHLDRVGWHHPLGLFGFGGAVCFNHDKPNSAPGWCPAALTESKALFNATQGVSRPVVKSAAAAGWHPC